MYLKFNSPNSQQAMRNFIEMANGNHNTQKLSRYEYKGLSNIMVFVHSHASKLPFNVAHFWDNNIGGYKKSFLKSWTKTETKFFISHRQPLQNAVDEISVRFFSNFWNIVLDCLKIQKSHSAYSELKIASAYTKCPKMPDGQDAKKNENFQWISIQFTKWLRWGVYTYTGRLVSERT